MNSRSQNKELKAPIYTNQSESRCLIYLATFFFVLILSLFPKTTFSQDHTRRTLFDTLYDLTLQKVEIELDIDSLILNKLTNKEQTCTLKVIIGDDRIITLPVSVAVRSKSRRRYCDFPPLKFDFNKSDLENLGLDSEDEYKIVTHCLENPEGEEVLLKEFMAYQLLQILTPLSLRAKLIDIIYQDKGSERKLEKKAILLENEKEFARNQNGDLCNCMGTLVDSLDALKYETLAMFQYMIGNIDMDHLVERNIKLIKPESGGKLLPFAYDFDYAALVNAPYVFTKVKDNKSLQRKYLGFRENQSYLPEVVDLFESKKDEILDYIKNYDLISSGERRDCIRYIKDFYVMIQQENLELPYKD